MRPLARSESASYDGAVMVGLGRSSKPGLLASLGTCALLLAVPACGDGLAFDEAAAGDDGGGTGNGGAGPGESDDEDDDDANDEDGGIGDETGGGSDGAPEDDAGAADECDADCGPGGTCILDEAGVPMCSCPDDAVAYGLRCVPCEKSDGSFDVELQSAHVEMTVTFNREPAPSSQYERGNIWLRDRASGDQTFVGDTRDGVIETVVLPGTYDVIYDRVVGGNIVPRNKAAVVIRQLDIDGDVELDVDVPVVLVHGTITLGGESPPDSQYETGELVLVDGSTGDEVKLGETRDGEFSARVLPGTYEVHYRRMHGGDTVPRNGDAHFDDIVVDTVDTMERDVDVPVVDIGGGLLLNGSDAPASQYETGTIRLADPETGDTFVIGETRDTTFDSRVIPGTYEVLYERKFGGAMVPVNEEAVVATVDVRNEPSFDIDIQTATISGDFELDGAPLPGTGEDAIVSLVDHTTGDEIALGHVSDGTFERIVVAGDYDLVYGQISAAGTLPANTGAVLRTVELTAGVDEATTVDVGSAAVSGSVLLGGQQPPTSEYSDARLYLRNPTTGDSVLLGSTRVGDFAGTVVPGLYDVVYVVETAGGEVPVNSEATLMKDVEVGNGTELMLDIPVFDVSGGVALDGSTTPGGGGDRANLLLRDVDTEDTIFLGGTEGGSFSRKITSGKYLVIYEGIESSGLMPRNEHAGVACFDLIAE